MGVDMIKIPAIVTYNAMLAFLVKYRKNIKSINARSSE
jgi:hypothetical protein